MESHWESSQLLNRGGPRHECYSFGACRRTKSTVGEEYGLDRLKERVAGPQLSPEGVLEDVCRFTGTQPLADDATVIVLQSEEKQQLRLF